MRSADWRLSNQQTMKVQKYYEPENGPFADERRHTLKLNKTNNNITIRILEIEDIKIKY